MKKTILICITIFLSSLAFSITAFLCVNNINNCLTEKYELDRYEASNVSNDPLMIKLLDKKTGKIEIYRYYSNSKNWTSEKLK